MIDIKYNKMSPEAFNRFKEFIEKNIGIMIPDSKKVMLESRLLKRVRILGMSDFEQYKKYFFSIKGKNRELPRFIECITTNKTDFFREIQHFNYLQSVILPELCNESSIKQVKLWSAASSSGEEAYTMAMFMEEYLLEKPRLQYKILATDISESVLVAGRKAVYSEGTCMDIPLYLRKRYCLISKDKTNITYRIIKDLRDRVKFVKMNLTSKNYPINDKFHVIFLRNVMIYFKKETQEKILRNLYNHLYDDGYLFLGLSEHMPNNNIPFKRVAPSIYKKQARLRHE